jgi:D-glycero-D-manno-heptose 1,7-bisphosphate phosphatase
MNASYNTVVIACGGKGQRLSPVTQTLPKPLLLINGKPFLENLIEQFSQAGATKFHLLLGYLPENFLVYIPIWEKKFEISIKYSISHVDYETGHRVLKSELDMTKPFLFLYGDVFLPLKNSEVLSLLTSQEGLIATYCGNDRKLSRNLIIKSGHVVDYISKGNEKANAVNCGYMVITPKMALTLNTENSVEDSILKAFSLQVIQIYNKYYTIGDKERLAQVREFFNDSRKILLLDRDGTLTKENKPAEYLQDFRPEYLRSGAIKFLQKARRSFDQILLITNQPQVGNKKQTLEEMMQVNVNFNNFLIANNCGLDALFICSHGWNDGCDCRKPAPGLMYQAQHFADIQWKRAFYIGDMIRDEEIASRVECPFEMVRPSLALDVQFSKLIA